MMNKKIKELFETFVCPNFGCERNMTIGENGEYVDLTLEEHWYTFQEGVELAVRECAKIAYECGPPVVYGSERQFDPITYTGNQILIHFGLE